MVIALSLGEIPEEVKEKIDNDWKKQIEGKLTKEERGELKKLEEENLKTIEEVYKSLKDDEEVQKWIEKIKSHEWVRVIGGRMKNEHDHEITTMDFSENRDLV